MRHSLPASLATIVIAIGLALTTVGISRGLPHEIGGVGSPLNVAADAWASGSAVSPPLVLLVTFALLAAVAMRSGPGGRRAARWLAAIAVAGLVAGLMEPVHQRHLLLQDPDKLITATVYAYDTALIALILAAVGRVRSDSRFARAVREVRVRRTENRGEAVAPAGAQASAA
jgi:heme exporter protein D